jgi:general secretion pathway protein D
VGDGEVSVSFVEESNALVIRAPGSQWEAIRRTIERLDVMPLQVHIEAQVLEVTLNDELRYGVSWFFENSIDPALRAAALGRSIWGDTAGSIGAQGTAGTGLSWTFLGPNVQAVVSALDSVSDVRVLSSPSVLVRSNAEAELRVGNSIPIQSTSFNPIDGGTGGGNGTFTNVQYLDTGVRLTVTPRVSPDGMVFMEIDQEVSSPGDSPDGQGNVPIATRNLTTQAAVQSGETVMLAGLISQTSTDGRDGVPGLSRLPVVGGLFGTQRRIGNRQEVVILITPRVVRDPNEARRLTDEYGRRFRAMDPLPVPADGGR